MKRLIILAALALSFNLFLGSSVAYSQATFKIPFKFEAEGKSFPPGNYWIAQNEDGKITLRRETGGEEVLIPFIERLAQPDPPIEEPQLIFDMVGNFEPSYTEYVTDYLLAEVWLTEKDGFLVLTTERAEYNKCVKGVKAKKRVYEDTIKLTCRYEAQRNSGRVQRFVRFRYYVPKL
jgi:hypothetical protein